MNEERYLRLGLRLDRLVEGTVDAYFGPPELAAAVAAEPPAEPGSLVADADALLAELPDGWLRDQVVGLRTCAGMVAGEALSYADEVYGYYGVRPEHTDEAVFAAAHEQLDELLPGSGPLAERYERWRQAMIVTPDRIERTVTAVIAEARAQTRRLVDLPDDEEVTVEVVRGESWQGYNFYLGDLRGRVAVNADLPLSALELLLIALHETYPGHQAERAAKEQRLVRGENRLEETIVLAPTPQSLISEGIGQLAPWVLLDSDGGQELASLIRGAGVDFDLDHALAVQRATEPCRWVDVNAALMLHADGADEAEVLAYLQRWGVLAPHLAVHVLRFITEPASRTYVVNYPAGYALCEAYVAGDPARLRHLLTTQVRVGELLLPA